MRTLIAGKADPALRSSVVDLSARTAREQAAERKRNEVLFSMLPQAQKDSILKSQAPTPAPKAADSTAKVAPNACSKADPNAKTTATTSRP